MAMLNEKQAERLEKELAKELPDEHKMNRRGRKFINKAVHFIMRLFFRIELVHPERVPEEGPVMLCANHVHYFDAPLIHVQLDRWVYWVARESLFRSGFSGRFMPWWGAIPLDVNNTEPRSVRMIMNYLKKGRMLGIFPQGTRCAKPEKLETVPPKAGAVNFAARMKAVILPVAVDGEFKLFRKTRCIIGEPYVIELPPRTRLDDQELMTYSIDLMEYIFSLMDKDYPLKNKAELTGGRKADYEPGRPTERLYFGLEDGRENGYAKRV